MGFWSGLGKIAKGIGGVVAAPATGGLSLLPTLMDVGGSVASGIAGAKTANRGTQDAANLTRDQLAMQAERDFLNRQREAYVNGIGSNYVQGWSPMAPREGIRNVYAGHSVSPDAKRASELMERRSMTELQSGRPYKISEPSKAGFWENLLGPVGLGLSAAGAMGDAMQNRSVDGGDERASGLSPIFTPDLSEGSLAAIDPRTYGGAINPSIWSNIKF